MMQDLETDVSHVTKCFSFGFAVSFCWNTYGNVQKSDTQRWPSQRYWWWENSVGSSGKCWKSKSFKHVSYLPSNPVYPHQQYQAVIWVQDHRNIHLPYLSYQSNSYYKISKGAIGKDEADDPNGDFNRNARMMMMIELALSTLHEVHLQVTHHRRMKHSVPQAKLRERGIPRFAGSFCWNKGEMLPKFRKQKELVCDNAIAMRPLKRPSLNPKGLSCSNCEHTILAPKF